jgi:hypothetical protein
MSQSAFVYPFTNVKHEISADGTTWQDTSGYSNSITVDGGERATDKTPTFDGAKHLVTQGKIDTYKVTARILYTEGAADPTRVVAAAFEAGTPIYQRWSPLGGASGQMRYTTTAGVVKKKPIASGEAASAKAILVEIITECSDVVGPTAI